MPNGQSLWTPAHHTHTWAFLKLLHKVGAHNCTEWFCMLTGSKRHNGNGLADVWHSYCFPRFGVEEIRYRTLTKKNNKWDSSHGFKTIILFMVALHGTYFCKWSDHIKFWLLYCSNMNLWMMDRWAVPQRTPIYIMSQQPSDRVIWGLHVRWDWKWTFWTWHNTAVVCRKDIQDLRDLASKTTCSLS